MELGIEMAKLKKIVSTEISYLRRNSVGKYTAAIIRLTDFKYD